MSTINIIDTLNDIKINAIIIYPETGNTNPPNMSGMALQDISCQVEILDDLVLLHPIAPTKGISYCIQRDHIERTAVKQYHDEIVPYVEFVLK